jgi:hypothetical protein
MKPAPRPTLSKTELQKRLDQHLVDRFHKEAMFTAHRMLVEDSKMLRTSIAERLDAFKWIAAFSTAAFLFVGPFLTASTNPVRVESVRGLLVAELAFLLSMCGAAGYMFVIDRRASEWARKMVGYTGRILAVMGGIDATAEELRDAIEKDDLVEANRAFWETYEQKEMLGKVMKEQNPGPLAPEGRGGFALSALCVGGAGFGMIAVGAHWLVNLRW